MKAFRWVGLSLALSVAAACGGGSHSSSVSPNVTSPVNGSSSSGPKSTMTITITRSATTTASTKRKPQTIPLTALSVDAEIWVGSGTSGSPVATSCVSFPSNATTATLSVAAPQGLETIQIASWSGACTASGGQGTTGTGTVLSEFTGTGTVLSTSTDLATVFNNGVQIALATPAGGTGTILTGPTTYTTVDGPAWGGPGVASALNYPVQYGFGGAGETIAIVIDSAVASSDYNGYLTQFQIPSTGRTITFESVDTASTTAVTADGLEAALDLETIAGLAPGANIIVYVIPSLSGIYIADAYNQIISDGFASVVNSSFGGCESVDSYESGIFATGVAAKIAFVASSGDQGAACYAGPNTYDLGVEYPASDPNVIGVGGTDTNTFESVPLTNPVVWNDGAGYGSGGGGVSTEFTIPSYQSGVASALASTAMRNVPDITGPATYAALLLSGAWQPIDGTSWSSPEFAAELAEIYQYCKTAVAAPNALLYSAYASASSDFIDVTSGNNTWLETNPTATFTGYAAKAGPDNTSGLGIPQGWNVAQTACPNRSLAFAPPAPNLTVQLAPSTPVLVRSVHTAGSYGTDLGERAAGSTTQVQMLMRTATGMEANEQAVLAALTNAGFTITKTFANHLVIDATAPNGTVESFFTTSVHNVNQGTLGTHSGLASSMTIPGSVAPYLNGVHIGDLVTYSTGQPAVKHH